MLLPKDYVRFKLTGEFATEVSDASGTAVFDVVNRRWSFDMMDGLGLDRGILPKCYESSEVTDKWRPRWRTSPDSSRHPGGGGGGTRHPAPWAMASWRRESSPARWAPPAWCSPTWRKWPTIRRPRPHLLPRGARQVARDGRNAGGRPEPAMFRNQLAPGAEYDALTAEAAQSPRGAQGSSGCRTDGRAHPAPRCHRARRLDWSHSPPYTRRPDPRGDRGRLLQPARLPGHRRSAGRRGDQCEGLRRRSRSAFWRQLLAAS